MASQIKRTAVKILPTNCFDVSDRPFIKRNVRDRYDNVFKRTPQLLATQTIPIVYIFGISRIDRAGMFWSREFMLCMTEKTNMFHLIFIHLTARFSGDNSLNIYKIWAMTHGTVQLFDTDILEAYQPSEKRSKRRLTKQFIKVSNFKFTYNRFNLFSYPMEQYRHSPASRHFQLMHRKYSNLHKCPIRVCAPRRSQAESHKKTKLFDMARTKNGWKASGYYALKLLDMQSCMNFSLKLVSLRDDLRDWKCHFYALPAEKSTVKNHQVFSKKVDPYVPMKIHSMQREIVVVPIIFATEERFEIQQLLILSIVFSTTILMFQLIVRICLLDKEAWSALMMLGVMVDGRTSILSRFTSVRVLCICLLLLAFFTSNNMVFSSIEVIFPIKWETRVDNVDDLVRYDTAVYISKGCMSDLLHTNDSYLRILKSKIRRLKNDDAKASLLEIMMHRNASLVASDADASTIVEFAKTFQLMGFPVVRETAINFETIPVMQAIVPWSCFYNRFSDFNWRYAETGHAIRYFQVHEKSEAMKNVQKQFTTELTEGLFEETYDHQRFFELLTFSLVCLTVAGSIVALAVLSLEVLSVKTFSHGVVQWNGYDVEYSLTRKHWVFDFRSNYKTVEMQ